MDDKKKNGKGITSLVLGIIGIIFFFIPYIAIVPSILSIMYAKKQRKIKPTGLSDAGLVLGIIGTVINSLILLLGLLIVLGLIFLP